MIKNITIASLSSGAIGEDFARHEVDLGLKRFKDYGVNVKFTTNALKGIKYLKENPDKRADDLIEAFSDPNCDMILCAIGGDDTYRLTPYLFDNDRLKNVLANKVFLGFSDSTINHLMLHKLGLNTFYGQSFLADVCELDSEMLPYSKKYFDELLTTGRIDEIRPSDVWYDDRTDWSVNALGTKRAVHQNEGFKLLQGNSVFSGKILGGCIDSIYDLFTNNRYNDTTLIEAKYNLFPSLDDLKDKIILLETSEEEATPENYRKMLEALKGYGIFDVVAGVICGKPHDNKYFDEYNKALVEVIDNKNLPIVTNISIGHATPRCIIPFGVEATVDTINQVIKFKY